MRAGCWVGFRWDVLGPAWVMRWAVHTRAGVWHPCPLDARLQAAFSRMYRGLMSPEKCDPWSPIPDPDCCFGMWTAKILPPNPFHIQTSKNHNWIIFCRSSCSWTSHWLLCHCQDWAVVRSPLSGSHVRSGLLLFFSVRLQLGYLTCSLKLTCCVHDAFSLTTLLSQWSYRGELTFALPKAFIELKLSWLLKR